MRLLIIGKLEGYIAEAGRIASSKGAKVAHIDDVDGALIAMRAGKGGDLIMVDVKCDIAKLALAMKDERFTQPMVACGIGNDAGAAVRAIKAGAKEYIPLPPDADLIAAVLAAVAEETTSFVSKDPAMQSVLKLADQIAPSDASVLITGESGTGKEVMARYIHARSKRANANFVALNCAAIPENLLESELFGHEKGAFTGAIARRVGKFEEASGGTLLLDEVTEMHPRLQAKLLRALQEREIDRVGGSGPVKVDVRILATSNRNMADAVKKGDFREDLYYRLNVMNIKLPALRERPADVAVLAEHFMKKYAEANGVRVTSISPAARDILLRHSWRGNVRELENAMHRAVLLATGSSIEPPAVILSTDMLAEGAAPAPLATPAAQVASAAPAPANSAPASLVGRTVADVERDLIIDTLSHTLGNRTHAATILGISIRTLRNKLKQYSEEGVPVPPPAAGEPADRAAG
jgi:two-component system, response regulator FlrC